MPDKLPIYLLIDASAAMRPVLPTLSDKLNSLVSDLKTKKLRQGDPLLAVYSFAMNLKEISPLVPVREIPQLDVPAVSFPVRNLKQALSSLVPTINTDRDTFNGAKPILFVITAGTPMPALDERSMAQLLEEADFAKIVLFNLSSANETAFTPLTSAITTFGKCDAANVANAFQAILAVATGNSSAPARQPVKQPQAVSQVTVAQPITPSKGRQQPQPTDVPAGSAPKAAPATPANAIHNDKLNQDLEDYKNQNEFLQKRLQAQTAELANLKRQLETAQKSQPPRGNDSAELKTQLATLQKQLQAKDTELTTLKTQLDTAQKQLKSKDDEMAALNTQIATAKTAPAANSKEIDALNRKVDAWYNKAKECETQLKASQTQCDTTQKQLADAQKQLADAQKQLADTQQQLAEQKAAGSASADLQAKLDQANATISDLQAKLKEAEPYVTKATQAKAQAQAEQEYIKQKQKDLEKQRQEQKDKEFEDLFGLNDASSDKGFTL